ncbi:MAG: PAS domain S-box protein [Desulfarculus sp.]|nr:PAS domain S-box protein [Desulfarculus sp.]
MSFATGSIRARLMVLVLLAVLPALGIILYSAAQQRDHALTMAKEKALGLAREVSRLQNEHLARAEDMAFTLAQTSQVRGLQAAACTELFAAIMRKTPQLGNLSACTPDGWVFASGHPLPQPVNISDRPWLQQTLREGRPAVSGYVLGRIINKPIIAVTQPVVDEKGALRAVLVASSDLQWLNRSLDDLGILPGGAYVTIIDSQGVVLMRHPHPEGLLGQALPNAPLAQAVLGRREGVVQAMGIDGAQRVYGFAPLHPGRDYAYAIVGIPEDEAFAEIQRNHARDLLLLGLALALALAATWLVGGRLLARPVDSLLQVTKRLAQGDLAARSGLPRGSDELSQLAAEFDGMAESLAWQYTELQQSLDLLSASNRALRMLGHSNQAMIRAGDETRLMEEVCRIVVEEGGHQMAWVGLVMQGEGQPLRPVARWGDRDGLAEALQLTGAEGRRGNGPAAVLSGGPMAFDDLAGDPEGAPWRAAALERGYASAMALPLRADGEILGSLHVYSARVEAFPQEEVNLLAEMADDLAFGIKGLRARGELERATEELRRHRDDLEGLVTERTTELNQANERLKWEMAEHLRAEQQALKLAAIVESSTDGIISKGLDGLITSWNQGAEQIYGYQAEEVLGRHTSMLAPPERAGEISAILDQIKQGQAVSHFETVRRRKDGSFFDVSLNVSPLRDSQGQVIGASTIARDITERKLAQAELARSNAELEQFAYVASHDLQEPLRIVTNYLQLLERRNKGRLDADAEKFITQAVKGAARMRGLIQDLLAYSRVGTRGKSLELVSAETVMEDVQANLKIAIEACGAVVTSDPLPTVRADASQLGQLMQNLVGNALKFRGTDPPRVHVSARREGGEWVFAVRDNGIGIEPQYLERIFGVFQRLHTRAEYPGTGIGLAICRRIVERHKGRIWVESRPGQGTAFYFSIPAEEGRQP